MDRRWKIDADCARPRDGFKSHWGPVCRYGVTRNKRRSLPLWGLWPKTRSCPPNSAPKFGQTPARRTWGIAPQANCPQSDLARIWSGRRRTGHRYHQPAGYSGLYGWTPGEGGLRRLQRPDQGNWVLRGPTADWHPIPRLPALPCTMFVVKRHIS